VEFLATMEAETETQGPQCGPVKFFIVNFFYGIFMYGFIGGCLLGCLIGGIIVAGVGVYLIYVVNTKIHPFK
jgi:hypothetical protein